MKRLIGVLVFCAALAEGAAPVAADYRPPPKQKEESWEEAGWFSEAVDLSRFRKGNADWDTQELIASGLTALHEEHVKILSKLDKIEARLERMERERGRELER